MTPANAPIGLDATPADPPAEAARPRRGATLLGAYAGIGLLLIGFNLRIGVAGVGLVLPDIEQELDISPSVASLLTAIPIVAFGAFAFLTPPLMRRIGLDRLLGLSMAAAALGIALRMVDAPVALFAGTVLVGAAIAVGNVGLPTAIKRDFAERQELMMALYTTSLFLGAAMVAACIVPLMSLFGGSWRAALGFWAIPAAVAFLVWIPRAARASDRAARLPGGAAPAREEPSLRRLLRDRLAWAVTGFMGLQSLTYYAAQTWSATLLQDAGASAHDAGLLLSYAALPGLVAALAVPAVYRVQPTWLPVAISTALCVAGFAGLLVAPGGGAAWAWMTCLGLGQGSAISLALGYIVLRSPDARHTGHLSAMAQGIGYLFAWVGPFGLGVLYTVTGGWTIPIGALIVLLLAQFLTGAAASRARHVLAVPATRGRAR